ncbi:GntR family transcriptional regulator [Flavisphingomonas formosensis]|uniref:GntR family transcriptional regulator n=1 Tax=Flavisphingomonas formosensis TaxID=861534 RepID=UPI0012FBD0B5|nr:GntR family transcriptional regulator [Sphingomonas formosensis]
MKTVTEQVISEIRERILDGKYGPGAHLHEATLAADLGVSRTPIRDALRVLGNEDLLVYYPNRGYIVRSVELHDVLDAYDVRGTLEGLACRVIAERGLTEAQREGFAELIERGDTIFASPSWGQEEQSAWRALNSEFHYALLTASNNRHLEPIMRQIRFFPRIFDSRLDPQSEFFQNVHTREQRVRSHHDHMHIVEALIRGEGARVEALMREHVYANRELLRRAMEGSGTF